MKLKEMINRYMPSSLSTLVALVIMASVTSCERCKLGDEDNGIPTLVADKNSLKDPDRDVQVTLQPDSEKIIDLTSNNLQVKLEVEGGKPENSTIEYDIYDDIGNLTKEILKGEEEKSHPLNLCYNVEGKEKLVPGDNEITKKFTFKPEAGLAKKMTVTFRIINNNGEPVGTPCVVTWEAETVPTINIQFAKPGQEAMRAKTPLGIELDNKENTVKPSEIIVELLVSHVDVTFDLGAKKRVKNNDKITLADILGNDDELIKNGKIKFPIKNHTDGGRSKADVTLKIAHQGKQLAIKQLRWHVKHVDIKFTIPKDDEQIFSADKEYEFVLTNKGDKINGDEIVVKLVATNGVEFTLGGQDASGAGKTLSEILGDKADLTMGGKGKFKIKLSADKGQPESKITLVVEYKGKEIAKREIMWKAKHVAMKFTTPGDDVEVFSADKEYGFVLTNKGEEVNSDEIVVKLVTTNGVEFTLGGQDASGVGKTLSEVRKKGQANLAKNKKSKFKIKLSDNKGQPESKVTLIVEYKGKEITKREIMWKAKHVVMEFTTPEDDVQVFSADKEYEFVLTNKEEEVNSDEIVVKLVTTNGVEFTLGGQAASGVGKALSQILGDKVDLATNKESKFKIKLSDNKGQPESKVTLVVEYKGKEIAKREIMWKAKHVAIEFTTPEDDVEIFSADKEYEFVLTNKEEEVNSDEIVVKLVATNGVEFTLGGQDASGAGKTLSELRRKGQTNLAKNKKSKFKIKLSADKGQRESKVTLIVEYKGKEITKREIMWKNEHIAFEFTSPAKDNESFNKDLKIRIKNVGDTVNSDNMIIQVSSENEAEFTLGEQTVNGTEIKLTTFIGVKAADIKKGEIKLALALKDAKGKTSSKITINIKYRGEIIAQRIIEWKDKKKKN